MASTDQLFELSSGLYWADSITATGVVSTSWTQAVLSIKANPETDNDAAALLVARVSNAPAGDDGLLTLNGAAAGDATLASVTVSATTPNTTISWIVKAAAMAFASTPNNQLYTWEITRWIGSGRKERLAGGQMSIGRSNLRAAASP